MTVGELIEALQDYNASWEVWYHDASGPTKVAELRAEQFSGWGPVVVEIH